MIAVTKNWVGVDAEVIGKGDSGKVPDIIHIRDASAPKVKTTFLKKNLEL